jgi:hypothetical protein
MKNRLAIALLSLGLILTPTLTARTQQSASPQKIDPAKEAVIRHLLEVTGGKKMMDQLMTQMFAQVKGSIFKDLPQNERGQKITGAFFEKIQAKMKTGDLLEQMIPIYDKYFTEADLQGVIQFYQSPLGQRFLQVMPQISGESMAIGIQWGQKISREIWAEMEAEFPELKAGQKAPPNEN